MLHSPAIIITKAGSLLVSSSLVRDTQIYSVLFTGLLTNIFVPVRLCPNNSPLVSSLSLYDVLFTSHAITIPVTLHVSSIGNGVRPETYVTLLGPSIIVPVQL